MGGTFRVGGALIVGAILVGGAFVLSNIRNAATAAMGTVPVAAVQQSFQVPEDTDQDGMPNWEEELRGTDPNTPNPRPTAGSWVSAQATSTYTPATTLTDRFGREFLESYVRAGGGQGLEEGARADFINSAISSLEREARPRFYTRLDIMIDTGDEMSDVREYGNTLGKLLVEQTPEAQDVYTMVQDSLKSNDFTKLTQLQDMVRAYSAIVAGMRTMPVPPQMITDHLNLLNTYNALIVDLQGIGVLEDDPLFALLKIKQYKSDLETLITSVENIRTALEQQGIVYTNEEYGIFFFALQP